MATDQDIEQFIGDSFSSIWDLELLAVLLESPEGRLTGAELVERMRASELVVQQGIQALVAAGIGSVDEQGQIQFQPASAALEGCARRACEFYRRFPGRARRLMIARHNPGLTAFADAFRLRKD
jgi:hypothetical protein